MTAELWYSLLQYFVGVIIILALLFALTEASRRYDELHLWPHFLLATGYFLLIVWALIRTLPVTVGSLQLAGQISQILGLLTLAYGYISLGHKDRPPVHSEPAKPASLPPKLPLSHLPLPLPTTAPPPTPLPQRPPGDKPPQLRKSALPTPELKPPAHEEKKPEEKKVEGKKAEDWVTMLTAKEPFHTAPHDDRANETDMKGKETISAAVEDKTSKSAESAKPAHSEKEDRKDGQVDLSYLANRKRKSGDGLGLGATGEKKVGTPLYFGQNKEKTIPLTNQLNDGKKETTNTEAKPQLPSPPAPQGDNKPASDQETREELMDDLFPLKNHEEVKPIADNSASKQVATELPGERREKSNGKEPMAIGLLASGTSTGLVALTSDSIVAFLLFIIMVNLFTLLRHKFNNRHLLLGFTALFLSSLGQLIENLGPSLPPVFTEYGVFIKLLTVALEVIGFGLIGSASWLSIKGKVTHHFLTVVGLLYGLLIAATVGIALTFVTSTRQFQLLIFAISSILIVILPIIHSLSYNRPATSSPKS